MPEISKTLCDRNKNRAALKRTVNQARIRRGMGILTKYRRTSSPELSAGESDPLFAP
jgi:hypothetical protein